VGSTDAGRTSPPLRHEQLAVLATLAILTAAAWWLTLASMPGMPGMPSSSTAPGPDAGPMGAMEMPPLDASDSRAMTDPGRGPLTAGALLVFLGLWVVMMAAMMLPSAVPMILTFGTVYRRQRERGGAFVPTWVFVAGYLLVWGAFGLVAWLLGLAGQEAQARASQTADLAPRLAAAAMLGAGLYQLTPLKFVCLQHCRSPLAFVLHHWRPGLLGALRMGSEHGAYCVGCCWMLMVLLVVVGLASVPWMGAITLIILAEKVLPPGRAVTLAVAASLLGLGALALAQPALIASV
jgi:predicted metal-binding membrane protein